MCMLKLGYKTLHPCIPPHNIEYNRYLEYKLVKEIKSEISNAKIRKLKCKDKHLNMQIKQPKLGLTCL